MTKIKICGITNITDAVIAVNAGADYLGFILYPKSPRYVAPEVVAEIVQAMRDQNAGRRPVQYVGVFVNEPVDAIERQMARAELDYAQLHGDERPEALAALAGRAYKALRPADREQALAAAEAFWRYGPVDGPRLLIDAYDPQAYGGTGQRTDWVLAAELAKLFPQMLLAGGLTPANAGAAVTAVQPWGLDVSSGVEARPGSKDHAKVREFLRAALFVA